MLRTLRSVLLATTLACIPFWSSAANDSLGEPEVTIIQQDNTTIEEYRINGFLYAVRIVPEKGKPYYLVRAEGQGEDFYHSAKPKLRIPSWEIYTW